MRINVHELTQLISFFWFIFILKELDSLTLGIMFSKPSAQDKLMMNYFM